MIFGPQQIKSALDPYVIGQERAKRVIASAVAQHYLAIAYTGEVRIKKSNVLLLGNSGSGKTLIVETLARILDVPFVQTNAMAITPAGWVGEHIEDVVLRLYQRAKQRYGKEAFAKARRGITYLDECFPPETELLTEDGFVRFDRVDGTRRVAQYHSNGTISFIRPERVVRRWHEGEMIRFRAGFGVHVSTPRHRRVVFKPNGSLFSGEVRQTVVSNYRVPVSGIADGPGVPLSDAELRLLVAFLADGCVKNKVYGYITLKRPRKIKRMDEILSALAIKVTRRPAAREYVGYYFGRFFESVLRKDGSGKLIKLLDPSWLTELSAHQREVFLDEIVEWDGSHTEGPATQFFSSELSNAELVSAIATTGGYSTHIGARHKKGYRPNYAVTMSRRRDRTQQGKRSLTRIPYSGLVYCVTVPTGMIVVRHEGFTQISGNCDKLALRPPAPGAPPSQSSDAKFNTIQVQQALLRVIEGIELQVDGNPLDTSGILFIGSGAFVGLDIEIQRRQNSGRTFSRGAPPVNPLRDVIPQDLIAYGLIPEFVGRFPVTATLDRLTEDDLIVIMRDARGGIIEQKRALLSTMGCDLQVSDGVLRIIARQALAQGTGARGIQAIVEKRLEPLLFDLVPNTLLRISEAGVEKIGRSEASPLMGGAFAPPPSYDGEPLPPAAAEPVQST